MNTANNESPDFCSDRCPSCVDCGPAVCGICSKAGDLFTFVDWNGAVRMDICESCAEADIGVIYDADDAAPVAEVNDNNTTPVPAMSMAELVFGGAA